MRQTVTVQIKTRLVEDQVEQLRRMYEGQWWTKGRTLDDIRVMLQHSDLIFGLVEEKEGRLMGFARVLTDRMYKALILDLIVDEDVREQGFGRQLMEAICGHPDLCDVYHMELYCLPEMIPFYKKWGFTDALDPLCFMRRKKP